MRIFRQRAGPLFEAHPEFRRPCHTCAFSPTMDGARGQETTILRLIAALEKGLPFWCHEPMPRTETGWQWQTVGARVCMGWAAVVPDRTARLAFVRGACGATLTDEEAEAKWAAISAKVCALGAGPEIPADLIERRELPTEALVATRERA